MTNEPDLFGKASTGKFALVLSIIVAFFLIVGNLIDTYKFAVVGAIFEILWLPAIIAFFFIPVVSIIIIFKKNTRKFFPIVSFSIIAGTLIYLLLYT